jgi:hypothetical protein
MAQAKKARRKAPAKKGASIETILLRIVVGAFVLGAALIIFGVYAIPWNMK